MKKLLYISFFAALLCSCERKSDDGPGMGSIDVHLAADVPTRAVVELTPEQAADYNIAVFNANTGVQQGSTMKYAAYTPVYVRLNNFYYVTAESCTASEAEDGMGKVRYAGKSANTFLTSENFLHVATVECSVANARVTVTFDESILNQFTDLKVSLSTDANASRVIEVPESSESVSMYFNPSKLTYTITGTFIALDKPMTFTRSRTLAAKNNVKLLVKLEASNAVVVIPQITVDDTFDEETSIDCGINPYK